MLWEECSRWRRFRRLSCWPNWLVVSRPWYFLKSLSRMKCLRCKQNRCLLAVTKPRQASGTDKTCLPTKYVLTFKCDYTRFARVFGPWPCNKIWPRQERVLELHLQQNANWKAYLVKGNSINRAFRLLHYSQSTTFARIHNILQVRFVKFLRHTYFIMKSVNYHTHKRVSKLAICMSPRLVI